MDPLPHSRTAARLATFTAWYARLSWWRLVAARRIAAALLALLALGLEVRAQLHRGESAVVVAAHDLKPGTALQSSDLVLVRRPPEQIPAGAAADVAHVMGRTVAGPVRTGEAMTDARVISPRLAQLATGVADARVVPVHLPDQALADMLRPGDIVDVVTAGQHQSGPPQVLARSAVVLLVSQEERSRSGQVTLIAMSDKAAQAVAAVTLVQSVTLLLR